MTALVFERRFLADYARNPVNLLFLVLVPVVFVVVAAGSLADAAMVFGGAGAAAAVPMVTAGWAAAFLSGIAMYFQTAGARDADRRLVIAGLPARRLVAARLGSGLVLALLASAAALIALAARTGVGAPARAVTGTLMFAVIYLGIGALIGALVPNPANGTVLVMFVWILDVFFGPVFDTQDSPLTRGLPTHFVTVWMADLPLRHGGRLGDLGVAAAWTVAALLVAFTTAVLTSRTCRPRRRLRPGSGIDQFATAALMGWRQWRRNPVLWLLMVAVPSVFVLLAQAVTPHRPAHLTVVENGRTIAATFDLTDIHAGTMTPIAVATLAAVTGLFVVLDTATGDRRLALAGLRPAAAVGARLTVVTVVAMLATAASLAVTATVFQPRQWAWYATANTLLALTYALVGTILAPLFGRVAGVFVAFLIPFLDLGMAQSPMLRTQPATWAHYLPGYGASRVLIDAAVTNTFDTTAALLIALAWTAGLAGTATLLLRTTSRPTPLARAESRYDGEAVATLTAVK